MVQLAAICRPFDHVGRRFRRRWRHPPSCLIFWAIGAKAPILPSQPPASCVPILSLREAQRRGNPVAATAAVSATRLPPSYQVRGRNDRRQGLEFHNFLMELRPPLQRSHFRPLVPFRGQPFTYHYHRGVGVGAGHFGQDAGIGDPQAVHAAYLQALIDHGCRVAVGAHLAGSRHVPR